MQYARAQGFTNFIWFCRQLSEYFAVHDDGSMDMSAPSSLPYTDKQLATLGPTSGTAKGCFRQGPGLISVTGDGSSLTFSGHNMRINDTYVFRVIGVKGDRNSTAEVMINIVAGDPPNVELG